METGDVVAMDEDDSIVQAQKKLKTTLTALLTRFRRQVSRGEKQTIHPRMRPPIRPPRCMGTQEKSSITCFRCEPEALCRRLTCRQMRTTRQNERLHAIWEYNQTMDRQDTLQSFPAMRAVVGAKPRSCCLYSSLEQDRFKPSYPFLVPSYSETRSRA